MARQQRRAVWTELAVGVSAAVGVGAYLTLRLPRETAAGWRGLTHPVLEASATILAALFIAIAIEVRHEVQNRSRIAVGVLSLALGLLASLAGLLPLPASSYAALVAVAIGGVSSGLVAAGWLSIEIAAQDLERIRAENLEALADAVKAALGGARSAGGDDPDGGLSAADTSSRS